MYKQLLCEIQEAADKEKAVNLARFFKTGKGEYGEGDVFLGITVPVQRMIVRKFKELPQSDVAQLLKSKFHERRLIALLILIEQFNRGDDKLKKLIFDIYLSNTRFINNWDLVDLSALHIIGAFLLDKDRNILYTLVKSDNLWERRIAILSCFAFIRQNDFDDALHISEILLGDSHDLIHKAVGWMLREIGKRDLKKEEQFLNKHYRKMPRTMLRYSIERFVENKKAKYMKKVDKS